MKTLTRKFGLIMIYVALASLLAVIAYTNIYCTILPNACTSYDIGANGVYFKIN